MLPACEAICACMRISPCKGGEHRRFKMALFHRQANRSSAFLSLRKRHMVPFAMEVVFPMEVVFL